MINMMNVTTLYVSQEKGNDNYTGFLKEENGFYQGPLKKIETALERIADLRRAGGGQPISIVVLDEIYKVEQPVMISNKVSRVTIRGLKNTTISGGIQIKGFQRDVFNGADCFSAEVPEGFCFTDLFVDGEHADYTSFPKEGVLYAQDFENHEVDTGASSKWFIAMPEDLEIFKRIKKLNECVISFNHYWVDEHTPIESCDLETGKITFLYKSRYTIDNDFENAKLRYRIENAAEAFEYPNEWYLDRDNAKVYYIPRSAEQTPENIKVYAPVAEKLFIIKGTPEKKVENICFENLTFAHTRGDYISVWKGEDCFNTGEGREYLSLEDMVYASDDQSVQKAPGAIEFYYAKGCAVEHCLLRNLGIHGIAVESGCVGTRIYGNTFRNLGAGGVKVGGGAYGCDRSEETCGSVISQNVITQCGKRYAAACGVLLKHTFDTVVSHNEISYLYYTGISLGWVWGYADNISRDNIIEKNHIHHIGQGVLSDMGGIYALGVQPGTILRGNVIHDVVSRHYGGHCIYTDEGSAYMLIENNICYGGNSTGFNQHYGRMNTIRNNIFVKSGEEPVRSSKWELHNSIILEGNIIVADGTASYQTGYGRKDTGYFQKICGIGNLHYNTKGDVRVFKLYDRGISLEEAQQMFGTEYGSIIGDPCFVDYKNNDFRLQDDSPAFAMGFEPIDTTDVGVTIHTNK